MAPKKRVPNRSKKSRAQIVTQSVRMTKSENRSMKAVAARKGITFNRWATAILLRAVQIEGKNVG